MTTTVAAVSARAPGGHDTLLAVRGLARRFGETRALDGVDLDLRSGEVHALCGENGAGKSTLVRILAGMLAPDAGHLEWCGLTVHLPNPGASMALGIAVIHQDFNLAPNLSVAENLVLGREPRFPLGLIDARAQAKRVQATLARVGLGLDPDTPVGELTTAQRQRLAIARALCMNARLLVMDEPTSALAADDIERLLALIAELRAEGTSVLFISHKLNEVFRIADRITVLRDGRSVGERRCRDTSRGEIIELMVGRALQERLARASSACESVVLEVRDLVLRGAHAGINLSLRAGEIVGLYGLQGAGRQRLAKVLLGLEPAERGEILLDGRPLRPCKPQDALRMGLARVPPDRQLQGLFPNMDVRENLTIAALEQFSRLGMVRGAPEREAARGALAGVGGSAADPARPVTELSGGNQQKVLLARWLLRRPRVLVLEEPTAGIDVGAKADIHALLDRLAAEGVAILLLTSELPELLGMSDRVLVMAAGTLVGHFERGHASEERIMAAIQDARSSR